MTCGNIAGMDGVSCYMTSRTLVAGHKGAQVGLDAALSAQLTGDVRLIFGGSG